MADELLDVDAAVAEGAALAVRLGDLGLDGDDALEPRLEVVSSFSSSGFCWRGRYLTRRPYAAGTVRAPEDTCATG